MSVVTISLTSLSLSFQVHLRQLFEEEWKNKEGKQVLSKKLVLFFLYSLGPFEWPKTKDVDFTIVYVYGKDKHWSNYYQ